MYQVEESYDSKTNEWILTVTMPSEDKEELEKICGKAGLTIEEVTVGFIKWLIAEPREAVAWLRGDGQ